MTTKGKLENPARAVFTPGESAEAAIRAAENVQKQNVRGLRYFIRGIDEYIAPMLPGQIALVVAKTSQYKSGSLDAWQYDAANQLMEEGRLDEAIVVVSAEETIEEQMYRLLGRESGLSPYQIATGKVKDWDGLKVAAMKVGSIPIYRIADSIERSGELPELYFSNVIRALEALSRGDVTGKPVRFAAIFADYLQAFPYDPEVRRAPGTEQRRLQVQNDFERMYQGSKYFNCPMVVAAQAKSELKDEKKDHQLPGEFDVHESTDPGRRTNRFISQWMPKMTHSLGDEIKYKGVKYRVTDDMLWVKAVKQRGGLPAGAAWLCQIDYKTNTIRIHPEFQRLTGGI